jgi:hypothetical protein
MRTSAVAFALALAVTAAAPAAEAATRTIEFTKIVGDTATAQWDYTTGNIVTFVSVVVTNNNVNENGGKSKDAFLSLAISQAEVDTGNVLITGSAFTNNFDFRVDRDLKMATLHVKDAIFQDDNSFTFFNVNLDLTWNATATATTSTNHDRVRTPGMLMLSLFKGEFRDATATGSVFGKNIQFTPGPSDSGQLQHNKFGTLTISTGRPH